MSRRCAKPLGLATLSAILIGLALGCCCPWYNQYQDVKKLVPVGTVSGTVYAGSPKQPVPNARVVIADQETTTSADGKFKLTNVLATTQTITVTAPDLKWTGTITVTKDGDVNLPEIILQGILPLPTTDSQTPLP